MHAPRTHTPILNSYKIWLPKFHACMKKKKWKKFQLFFWIQFEIVFTFIIYHATMHCWHVFAATITRRPVGCEPTFRSPLIIQHFNFMNEFISYFVCFVCSLFVVCCCKLLYVNDMCCGRRGKYHMRACTYLVLTRQTNKRYYFAPIYFVILYGCTCFLSTIKMRIHRVVVCSHATVVTTHHPFTKLIEYHSHIVAWNKYSKSM